MCPIWALALINPIYYNEVVEAVKIALNVYYRRIDTASVYKNKNGIGVGIKESRVPREAVFIVSKVWNTDQGYDAALQLFEDRL
ncbi:MAG: diketogulonate reductase-like aldo/keto reductase [Maribacter sp.]|jgi:diketogulonate reductase-like aldo/keto reductase